MMLSTSMMEIWKSLGNLFLLAGSTVVFYGAYLARERRGLTRGSGPLEGLVIRRLPGARSGYRPVVSFSTPQGEQIVFESRETFPDRRCRVGTCVPVLYDGADPARTRVDLRGWYDVAMTVYLGALVTAAGVALTLQQLGG